MTTAVGISSPTEAIVDTLPGSRQYLEAEQESVQIDAEIASILAMPRLAIAFDGYWAEVKPDAPLPSEHQTAEYQAALEQEVNFYRKVMVGALTMAERHNGKVTLLFDVDLTLVNHKEGVGRPAMGIVVDDLNKILPGGIEVGLLSTRPQSSLSSQAIHPTYMRDVEDKINPSFLIGSTEIAKQDDETLDKLFKSDDSAAKLELTKNVVEPDVIEETMRGLRNAKDWYDTKLVILDHLALAHPERTFVWVDDTTSASVIRPDHPQIAGVHVFDESLGGALKQAAKPKSWRLPIDHLDVVRV